MCEPGFPVPDWICSVTTVQRGVQTVQEEYGWHVTYPSQDAIIHFPDFHEISLIFLPRRTFLQYPTAPESHARFSPKYSSIFSPPVHSAWYSALFLWHSRTSFQDMFLTIFLSLDFNISLPLPLPLPNHSEIYSLVDIDSSSLLNPSLRFLFSSPIICKLHHFYLSLCWKSYHERETFLFSFF